MTVAWMQAQRPVRTADASVDPPTVELPVRAHPAGPAPVLPPTRASGTAATGWRARVATLAVAVALVLVAGVTTAMLFGTGLVGQLRIAGAATAAPAAGPALEPATFAVTGTVVLTGSNVVGGALTSGALTGAHAGAGFAAGGSSCTGTDAHADVREGAPVLVADATGTVVATGSLGPGRPAPAPAPGAGMTCTFPFSVPGVPTGTAFYLVELGRYAVTYSGADLRTYGASLRIGE